MNKTLFSFMNFSLDRFQHTAILVATALLPRRLRVATRLRGLGALQRKMLRRANVVFIRHPKTGGTWLRVMLAMLYTLKYGTSIRRVFRSDELYLQNQALPRYLLTHGCAAWESLVAEAFTNQYRALDDKRILFLARHPADVAVSWYVQYHKRERAFRREMLELACGETRDPRTFSQWEFITHESLGLPAIIEYHNFWARMLASRDNALIVRYEDLLSAPEQTLTRIGQHLGEAFSTDHIRQAVDFGSADNLRKLEQTRFFSNPSLRLRSRSDSATGKVRRARAGGYREDLSLEQTQWVDRMVASRLDPIYGYTQSDTNQQPEPAVLKDLDRS
jgi:hypothetical protein